MDWIQDIQRAIDYVETNITEEIDFEAAAKEAYSSSFHFQRVFDILCGFSLGEYIRMRRLSLAGEELSAGEAKIIDVALKYGYDTPESFFCRARNTNMQKILNFRSVARKKTPTRITHTKSGIP
jgi:AraC family transcriptional regulator